MSFRTNQFARQQVMGATHAWGFDTGSAGFDNSLGIGYGGFGAGVSGVADSNGDGVAGNDHGGGGDHYGGGGDVPTPAEGGNTRAGTAATAPAGPSADQTLADITREQWDYYLQQYGDLEQSALDSTNSTQLVADAEAAANTQQQISKKANIRALGRRGIHRGSSTAAQVKTFERNQKLGRALNTSTAVNNARLDQRERNLGVTADLMMQGRGVNSQANNGLGDVAGLEANRNANNAAAKAQNKANTLNTVVSLGTTAAMLASM